MTARPVLDEEWFPAAVPANAAFGEGSTVHSTRAFLHYRSARPCGLRVGAGSSVYDPAAFALGPNAEVRIGAWCVVLSIFCTDGRVDVGDHVVMGVGSVVADDDVAVPGRVRRGAPPTVIGDLAFLGARSVVLAGARIGTGAIVGAGTVVRGHVPDHAVVAGDPPRVVGWARP